MQRTHEQEARNSFSIASFEFECGRTLTDLKLSFETWGTLAGSANNAILITHALTGTSHAAGYAYGPPGWWDILIGPGKIFDPTRYFIICANVLGGCSGSTGPGSIDGETGRPYGMTFPVVTIRDMVRSQKYLIDHLGVKRLHTITGGSMGGMQALEWAALYPEMVNSIIPIAAPGRAYPQSIAFRKTQRKAIMLDPEWLEGAYYGRAFPGNGMQTARMMGFISYRSEPEFAERFGRNFSDADIFDLDGRFEVEQYLEYHGRKLATWFDANSYLYLSKAMDLHDLGYNHASYEAGLQRIRTPTLILGFSSDILFPSYQQKEIADMLSRTNPGARFREIDTIFGHDAFLIEEDLLQAEIGQFLDEL